MSFLDEEKAALFRPPGAPRHVETWSIERRPGITWAASILVPQEELRPSDTKQPRSPHVWVPYPGTGGVAQVDIFLATTSALNSAQRSGHLEVGRLGMVDDTTLWITVRRREWGEQERSALEQARLLGLASIDHAGHDLGTLRMLVNNKPSSTTPLVLTEAAATFSRTAVPIHADTAAKLRTDPKAMGRLSRMVEGFVPALDHDQAPPQ